MLVVSWIQFHQRNFHPVVSRLCLRRISLLQTQRFYTPHLDILERTPYENLIYHFKYEKVPNWNLLYAVIKYFHFQIEIKYKNSISHVEMFQFHMWYEDFISEINFPTSIFHSTCQTHLCSSLYQHFTSEILNQVSLRLNYIFHTWKRSNFTCKMKISLVKTFLNVKSHMKYS